MSALSELPKVLVSGQYYQPSGDPATGYVTAVPSMELRDVDGDYSVSPTTIHHALSASGKVGFSLFATDTDKLRPIGWTWRIEEHIDGSPARTWYLTLPAAIGAIDITALAPTRV